MKDRKIIVILVLLILALVNYYVASLTQEVRAVVFAKIFIIGFLSSRLIFLLIEKFKTN